MAKVRGFGVLVVLSFVAAACSSGRDVEVKGEVIAPASLSLDGKILVEFVDVIDVENREVVDSVELDAPGSFVDSGVAVLEFDHAWGIIEVPALEIVSDRRRIELYGTRGAFTIPHLGSGHLANKNIQPVEVFGAGGSGWERIDLPAATLQIADLREFAACAARRKEPDYSLEHDLTVQEALLQASKMA